MANKSKNNKISKNSKAISIVRKEKLRECLFCSRVVSSYPQLIIHMNFHNEERPFQCDECSNSYSDFRYLWYHRRSIHQNLQNKCNNCEYSTNFSANLQRHNKRKSCAKILNGQLLKNIIISVKPLVRKSKSVTVRKSRINSKNFQKSQRKQNIPKKPVTINIPPTLVGAHSKIFHLKPSIKMNVQKIANLNQKIKKLKKASQKGRWKRAPPKLEECLFCSESFPGFYGLSTHFNQHTGERPYNCELCSFTFSRKESLWSHVNSVHKRRQYNCNNCNYVTRFSSNLSKHKKSGCKQFVSLAKTPIFRKTTVRKAAVRSKSNFKIDVPKEKIPTKDQSVSVARPAPVPSLDPSKLLNLIKGLDRVSQLKRSEEPTKSSDVIPEDKKPNLDLNLEEHSAPSAKGLNDRPDVKEEPKLNLKDPCPKNEPKPNYPDLVYLPLDDPRSIQVAKQFPPFKQFSSMDLPEQPTNLFFSVNGQVTFPLLSVQYYRAWAPPPSPPPVYPDSDEYLEEDEETFIQEDNPKVPKPKPKDKRCIDKPFSCEICGVRFSRNNNLRRHGRKLHGKQLTPTPRTRKKTNGQSKPK